jgi:hypothetical protein
MKNTITLISLWFLVLFLLAGCVSSTSTPVKSGNDEYGHASPMNWIKFGSDDTGDVYFYEKGNLETNAGNGIVQVWEKNVLSDKSREYYFQKREEYKKSTEGWEKLTDIKSLTKIDCAKSVYKTSSVMFCDKHGKVLDYINFSDSKGEWKGIKPASHLEMLKKEVCK